ncbi:MAG: bifunctional diaminohydroxyphosphoribosylaminopyrimidine deaminase/5-amino-6-(5-phosphoribosylamino)uracil reductase RibD [Planctomycetota bacterium]|nr:bifunctional diaminohydroxyphosphoribosylaminopyrimidine deaminase/5-amino-6-(5-phosphoribosylamino)uracil reductase RibD [Planctomycetota bacterium]
MNETQRDYRYMQRALKLARQGAGRVEPNPMVGCVIVQGEKIVGEGFHTAFGRDHAEIEALRNAGADAEGGTLYVNLEPCCHHGKTGPCTEAILTAKLARVVVANRDPFPQVAGTGLASLREHGLDVMTGVAAEEAEALNAPYFHYLQTNRPWVIAKWAMSLDGKMATTGGDSRWISNPRSRSIVHQIRGRVDAILIGRRTAELDDPQLTARPPGPRTAVRIVLDSMAQLRTDSKLVRSAGEVPLMVVTGPQAPLEARSRLENAGCELMFLDQEPQEGRSAKLHQLLERLGERQMTNLLVEGGGKVLGSFFDAELINEVHTFIAPVLIGGEGVSPLGGSGAESMDCVKRLELFQTEQIDEDWYISGRFPRKNDA